VAPLLTVHGLDRQKGGAARQIASGVPGDEEVGFPAGSLPADGLPVRAPVGAAAAEPGPAGEQLALL
ncbi:MAG: radical SAM protein, partial [Blastococcus sp.]